MIAGHDNKEERLRRGERIDHFETVGVAKDGRRLDISLTVSPVRDAAGHVIEASNVARDVTDRKRVDAERGRLAGTLGLALAAADLGTWDWDPATDLITLSPRAAEVYGLPPGEAYAREWMRELIQADYRERARDEAARAVAERGDYDVEYPVNRPDGTVRWVAARGRGVYDAAGSLVRMTGVVQDVTGRKLDEERLARAFERERQQAALLREVADASLTIHSTGSLQSVLRVIAEEARRTLGGRGAR